VTPPAAEEQDSGLAALIGAMAEGRLLTDPEKDELRRGLIRMKKNGNVSWAVIGSVYGISGKEMKRQAHKLDRRVQRELMTGRRNG